MGNGFKGTNKILTSKANENILPDAPKNWSDQKYSFYKFSFINYDPATVRINNGAPIHLNSEQGFESSKDDVRIESFVIVTENVRYSYIGAY